MRLDFYAPTRRPNHGAPLPPPPPGEPGVSPSAHGMQTIEAGSSSFAAAARLFDKSTRESTVMLYAWCRHCDDVIDGQQLGHGRRQSIQADDSLRLAELERATLRACFGEPDEDPVFAGLGEVVRRHRLPPELLLEHLAGFRMDVDRARCETLADTLLYCYRVAGAVGLMMARVLGTRDPETLDRACDLGIAFQLSNIARDVIEDAAVGRIYLPTQWLAEAGIPVDQIAEAVHRDALAAVVARLVAAADPYYASAVSGIGALPFRSAWSVATARDVYRAIGRKVEQRGPRAWDERATTSSFAKAWFTVRGALVAVAARRRVSDRRAENLWQRPRRSGC